MRYLRFGLLAVSMGAAAITLATVAMTPRAVALEERAGEKEKLKACHVKLCDIVMSKAPAGDDLKCAIGKTWAAQKIKEGIEKRKVSWSFGDARCTIDVAIPRSIIVDALVKPAFELQLPEHTIACEVEKDKVVTPIVIKAAPKIQFKGGKADKIWIGAKSIDGPSGVRNALWAVVSVEDMVGLFQNDLVAGVNTFLTSKCPVK